jgi:uncharacterized membrane protein YvlD (DUF360 family)
MANIANILPILVILLQRDKNILDVIVLGFFTFKVHTFMLWHTSDIHKHRYFSLQAGISVPYD